MIEKQFTWFAECFNLFLGIMVFSPMYWHVGDTNTNYLKTELLDTKLNVTDYILPIKDGDGYCIYSGIKK